MVAHRSPKPLVWVRILLPLPKGFCIFMQNPFYFTLFILFLYSNLLVSLLNFLKEVIIKRFLFYFFILFTFIITSCINLFLLNIQNSTYSNTTTPEYYFSNTIFIWPLPGYHQITSYFGPRTSPTAGSSSNHSGIDIEAPS